MPLCVDDITKLLKRADLTKVYLKPYIEHTFGVRGVWVGSDNFQKLLVESTRPAPSRCKTVLHELIEPLWVAEIEENRQHYTLVDRERFANRFAAMVKMPPEMFGERATELGADVRELAFDLNETLAGVSRQIRDINLANQIFYYCRFDLANAPADAPQRFHDALAECNGICVRVIDVVRSFTPHTRSLATVGMPMFNLPSGHEYWILNPALRLYLREQKPIYLPYFDAGASFNNGATDLFGMNRIATLIYHYGDKAKSGFFITAVAAGNPILEPQLDRIHAIRRPDIDWLFRYENYMRPKPQKKPIDKNNPGDPPTLPTVNASGRETHMGALEFKWT